MTTSKNVLGGVQCIGGGGGGAHKSMDLYFISLFFFLSVRIMVRSSGPVNIDHDFTVIEFPSSDVTIHDHRQ